MTADLPIVVFCHLRWDFVYQRPQHLLSRLAETGRQVIVIEEPLFDQAQQVRWKLLSPQPNITVARPHTPIESRGFHTNQIGVVRRMVDELLSEKAPDGFIAWFYTPMALPLLDDQKPRLIVYDSMDALDAFLNAPPELTLRETELLQRADLVFTGGPSLYRRLRDRHAHVYCFTSSVDAKHFGIALNPIAVPADQAEIAGKLLGYFGVIDERLDLALLDHLAQARPDWQLVMVGPVVKISPSSLPQRANIHYLGQKHYAELPAYLAGWDVCLLPFARNEATRYISPTKVLEYMAAEKPIVSTPITDVAEPYRNIVYLADTNEEFVNCCSTALNESAIEAERRKNCMRDILAATSWDQTVNEMRQLMDSALAGSLNTQTKSSNHAVLSGPPAASHKPPVIVIGAGPTGLSAAYHLGSESLLLEQNDRVGGWCRSLESDGFTFDFAGHIMFSNEPYVHELYKLLLGDNVHWQDREAWIYSSGIHTRYPFQGALYGLPPEVITECVMGAIEARYGSSIPTSNGSNGHNIQKPSSNGNGRELSKPASNGNSNGQKCAKQEIEDCCGDGVLESTAELVDSLPLHSGSSEPKNFEEFIYKIWGSGIAKHFAIPYNQKLWSVPLSEMETSWLGGRVPMPNLEEMIEGALKPVPKPMGPNARFGYPLRGGFQALMDGFLPHVQDRLRYETKIVSVSPQAHAVSLSDGTTLEYDHLISTMPLPLLVRAIGEEAPPEVREAAKKLRFISVRCVHIGFAVEKPTEKHWIYYPGTTVFHRIFVQGNASPHCNPAGGFGITCEITYSSYKPLPCDGEELIARCIQECRDVGLVGAEVPVLTSMQVDLPHAYVVYDHGRSKQVALIREWLAQHDILLAGRYSEWEYYNSDHAFIAGKLAADSYRERKLKQKTLPVETVLSSNVR